MAINFPTSPATNDTHTDGVTIWKWDGTKWNIYSTALVQNGLTEEQVRTRSFLKC